MISPREQSILIEGIAEADGFVRKPFIGAAGIGGNLKVALPEALDRYRELKSRFVGHAANALSDVDVILATGRAVDIATEVAFATGQKLIEIRAVKRRGVKHFSFSTEDQKRIDSRPRMGLFEDVSSTLQTAVRATRGLNIQKVVVGFRRGEPATPHMTKREVIEYDQKRSSSALLEVPNSFTIVPIIERKLPLLIQSDEALFGYLPELEIIDQ